ncbi:T9SS type A sorting domain-containing protein, partial [candidate division KSB1 bacterium]|nr:T9SS type A sorting domain-containing protein [candidate division KSB1 bacterium]
YFARFFDENDSLVAYGTVSKSSFEPFDPPFSTVALIFGQSWKDNDFRGWMDDIKFFNYPKGLPPTFYSIDAANVLQNQPFTVMGAVAHPGTEISTVQVHYMFSSAPEQWQTMNMNLLSGATYTAEIPAQPIGTIMQYYLSAEATNGLRSTTPPYAETKGDYLSNAWWKAESQTLDLTFEEGPTGPLMDHSEYQQTLISYGNPQFSDDAKDGNYALALDGDSTYLEIVPAPFFNSGEYTVDFWFKPDASIATGVVFMVQEAEEWNKGPFFIQSRGDKFRDDVYIEGNEGIYRVRFNYGAKFKAGNWYRHILSVGRDSAYTEMRDKDDQILERQSTPINGHAVMVSGPFRLGAGQPDQAFTGKMDNVHIYNYSIGGTSTKVAQDAGAVPTYFALMQNYPNPFNPTTNIRYSVPTSEEVTLIVYDVLGRQVRKLVDKALSAGEYSITWDGKNDENVDVATGVYFYQLEARNKNVTKLQVRKMVLVH